MSDGAFPDRVTLLRNRWEADPSSRVFLQLAEEYRHQGRVKEALEVLDRGLKEHPGYLSALVAKGRCHLELGEPEPAKTVLERVVKQDATQMVANKLLVRAYLETSEPDRARDRLDLYSLLNDSDPEIEDLRRRLRAMEQPVQGEKPGFSRASDGPIPVAAPVQQPQPATMSMQEPQPAIPQRANAAPPPDDDLFDLTYSPRATAESALGEPFGDLLVPVAAPAAASPSVAEVAEAVGTPIAVEPEEGPEPDDVVFPGLASLESRRRYLASLAAEGLFVLDLTAEAPAPVAPPAPAPAEPAAPGALPPISLEEPEPPVEPVSEIGWELEEPGLPPLPEAYWVEPAPEVSEEEPEELAAPAVEAPVERETAPAFELEETTPWSAGPPTLAAERAAPPRAEPVATATLGELYLRQGHLAEAERIFREVLNREPDNDVAQQGLARAIARQAEGRPVEGRDLAARYEPAASGEAGAKARKRRMLNSYLQRLRRGSQRDVS